tara:strand:- start:622 stop:876 length:255 start_codon:yes stop_codon:yes gene_type:complete
VLYASFEKKYKTLLLDGVNLLLLASRYHVCPSLIDGGVSSAFKMTVKKKVNVNKINLVFIIILTFEFNKSSIDKDILKLKKNKG